MMESQLNPWAEPYVPTGEVIVAPIQVEYPASEEPVTPDLNAVPPTTEEQSTLPWSIEAVSYTHLTLPTKRIV